VAGALDIGINVRFFSIVCSVSVALSRFITSRDWKSTTTDTKLTKA
jgi:hypothetical protein